MHTTQHPAYNAMLGESRTTGLPHKFKNDLELYDQNFTARTPQNSEWLWYLYDSGTHIVTPKYQQAYNKPKAIVACIETNFPGGHWYQWDGCALLKRTYEQALEWAEAQEAQ